MEWEEQDYSRRFTCQSLASVDDSKPNGIGPNFWGMREILYMRLAYRGWEMGPLNVRRRVRGRPKGGVG